MKQQALINGLDYQLHELKTRKTPPVITVLGNEYNCNSLRVRTLLFYNNGINSDKYNYFEEHEKTQFSDKLASICLYALYTGHKELTSWCLVRLLSDIENLLSLQLDDEEPGQESLVIPFEETSVLLTLWFIIKMFAIPNTNPENSVFTNQLNYLKEQPRFFILMRCDSINPKGEWSENHYKFCYSYFLDAATRISSIMELGGLNFYDAYSVLFLKQQYVRPDIITSPYPARFIRVAQEQKQDAISILLKLLADYVQFDALNESKYKQKFFRFISGFWNQHHMDTISIFLENYYTTMIKKKVTCENLLEALGNQLISAGKPLKLDGTLANIIHFTQEKLGKTLINIDVLNNVIAKGTHSDHEQQKECSLLCMTHIF